MGQHLTHSTEILKSVYGVIIVTAPSMAVVGTLHKNKKEVRKNEW